MNKDKSENKFYVYVYLDPRKSGKYVYGSYSFDYEPFYVGKGHNRRYRQHLSESYNKKDNNSHKGNVIRKIKKVLNIEPIIIKYKENLSEDDSFVLEKIMIKTIGRYDLKTGPLTNKTDGGEGDSGYICTEKTRKLLSVLNTGEKNGFYDHKHTKKQRDLWSIKRKGYKHREEDKQKIRDIQKGKSRKWLYKVINPDGIVIVNYSPTSLVSICEKYGLVFKTFIKYTIYKNKDYKGWTAFRKLNNRKGYKY